MLIPQSGHEKLELKVSICPSIVSTYRRPFVRPRTVSIESVRRFSIPGFTIRRSTTISTLCFWFLSSSIVSERSYIFPSTRTRTKPLRFADSKTFSWRPLRPRTTGASSWIFCRSGSAMI